jgi:hypothetical protein
MKRSARVQGAAALGMGVFAWGVNVALTLSVGMFSPALVIFGGLGIVAGAVLVVWGESFKAMPTAQKIPAALIAIAVVALAAVPLTRWLSSINAK